MVPNLFIPGAPKCGTTALATYLSGHAQVFVGHVKEPNYWSSDMPSFARREGFKTEEEYLAMYDWAPAGTRYAVDASTHYLFSAVALERIARRFDNALFVVGVRPPSELAPAWHMQMVNAGYEDITDFTVAWRLIHRRREGHSIPRRCPEPRLLDYEGVASVGSQLQRLLYLVGAERVHVVPLSRLKEQPRQAYLALLEFLGLADDDRHDFTPANAAARNRSAFASRLVRNPVLRPHLNRATAWLGPGRAASLRRLVKRGLYRSAPRERLTPDFEAELRDVFAAEEERLQMALAAVEEAARATRQPALSVPKSECDNSK